MTQPRILIVDDSPIIRSALTRLLQDMGAEVVSAEHGAEGYAKALTQPHDLIITDVDMPHLNGFDLCKNLKEHPDTKAVPVIILSSRDREEDVEAGFDVGAAAYVSKSEASKLLPGRIRDVLARSTFLKERVVLVVDDSKVVREVVRDGLVRQGFKVQTARNGQEALKLLKWIIPDLVLTDLEMPVMDGRELCRALGEEERLARVPVVVMSTVNDRATMRRLIQEGASAYLTKPFNVEQLVITVEKLLSDHFNLLLEEKKRLGMEQELILAAITSLVNALEARDGYTRGHSEAVARLAVGMGRVMGFNPQDLERLRLVGRLHDLGKIGVRDSVLLKPGKLTDQEFEHIKLHTTVVRSILEPITSLSDVLEAASSHHERWDGKGYPNGLAGEDIPFLGRIIAVADIYDALTSERPYRTPMPREKALEVVRQAGGSQLCPDCLDAFLEYMESLETEVE